MMGLSSQRCSAVLVAGALVGAAGAAVASGDLGAQGEEIVLTGRQCPCRENAGPPRAWVPPETGHGVWPGDSHFGDPAPGALYGPPPAAWMPPPSVGPMVGGPPPGTLGRTYRVRTATIPVDKHPRVGMLDVYLPGDLLAREGFDSRHFVKVSIEDVEGFIGDDGNWHFETEPLIPGVSHVYNVRFEVVRVDKVTEVQYGRTFHKEVETAVKHLGYRVVRFIPGRVVELRY